jgi:hypothetical protein
MIHYNPPVASATASYVARRLKVGLTHNLRFHGFDQATLTNPTCQFQGGKTYLCITSLGINGVGHRVKLSWNVTLSPDGTICWSGEKVV